MLARMQRAAEDLSFREVADLTRVYPETARRYLTRGRPTAYFVAAFCRALGLSPTWLLYGQATMREPGRPKAGGFVEERASGRVGRAAGLDPSRAPPKAM